MILPSSLQSWLNRILSPRQQRFAIKAISFASIGVVNSLIDFGVFLTAYKGFDWGLIPANVLSWLVAMSASYVMNSFITFAAESGRKLSWRHYATFAASGVAGLVANTATLWVLVNSLLLPAAVAKLCAILVSFVVNFTLSHFFVFRSREHIGPG